MNWKKHILEGIDTEGFPENIPNEYAEKLLEGAGYSKHCEYLPENKHGSHPNAKGQIWTHEENPDIANIIDLDTNQSVTAYHDKNHKSLKKRCK